MDVCGRNEEWVYQLSYDYPYTSVTLKDDKHDGKAYIQYHTGGTLEISINLLSDITQYDHDIKDWKKGDPCPHLKTFESKLYLYLEGTGINNESIDHKEITLICNRYYRMKPLEVLYIKVGNVVLYGTLPSDDTDVLTFYRDEL